MLRQEEEEEEEEEHSAQTSNGLIAAPRATDNNTARGSRAPASWHEPPNVPKQHLSTLKTDGRDDWNKAKEK